MPFGRLTWPSCRSFGRGLNAASGCRRGGGFDVGKKQTKKKFKKKTKMTKKIVLEKLSKKKENC